MQQPIILITNDDSNDAKGLRYLVDCVSHLGKIYVVAPAAPHSGQSSAFTVNSPLSIHELPPYTESKCGRPPMHHILPRRPDILLSGVNHGSNAGNSAIYSGTMGAAFEGCMQGIPSVGYSLLHHSLTADFTECGPYISDITARVLAEGLPDGICLNINFPAKVKIEGMKVTRAARSHWTEEYQEYLTPHGKPFFWLTGHIVNEEPDATDTDPYCLDLRHPRHRHPAPHLRPTIIAGG